MTASARGLFKATGNKSKPKKVRLLDGSYVKVENVARDPDDFQPTPPEPTRSLLHYEAWRLKDFTDIWEMACGDGRMAQLIQMAGFSVHKSDLIDRGCCAELKDFFAYTEAPARAGITNPPYNKTNFRDGGGAWVWHALDVLDLEYLALLLPWPWPAAAGSAKLWKEHEPSRVYLMRWKIDFSGEGQPPMNNGWWIWDRKNPPNPRCQLLMMDRVDDRQGIML